MFTKKANIDLKKSTQKIQDSKKDSAARLRHLKTILEHVDSDEAKNLFEANYSHVYYILYDTFVQAEANLKQRELSFHIVHKTHREELDGSLWLLSKILCLLPELVQRRWQCHSLGRILAKLLHYGNSVKLRREGVKYFLLWYQALGDNAPPFVHGMFTELVPGLSVPQRGKNASAVPSDSEFIATDLLNHPNLKGELGGSVFHDTTATHPVKSPEIQPLIPPSSSERTAAPDPRDGLEILLDCMVQSCGCLKWRDNSPQRHIRTFNFLLTKFREQYLPVFCPSFDYSTSVYEPKLDLPVIRSVSKREEVMSSCVVVLIIWIAKYTHERHVNSKLEQILSIEDEPCAGSGGASLDHASLLSNLRHMGYTQTQLVRDVLYSSRETVNFVHEIYRQAFLMAFTSKSQIEAMRIAISVYRDWMSSIPPPPFLLEPDLEAMPVAAGSPGGGAGAVAPAMETIPMTAGNSRPGSQRLRTDSYLGAVMMTKENGSIRAGLQNVLQVFVTNAVNVFMVNTAHLNLHFQSKTNADGYATPLDEQTDICKRVLNIYRTMVMKTRMEAKTWEQLLLVLLQVTSVILQNSPPNAKKNNLGGRLAQPIFQTLIVTWIRAHTNVPVNAGLWDRFLKVLSSLTHREELIVEWDKTMQTLTRVLARQVYNINLSDLPLDRLAEQKGKRKRGTPSNWTAGESGRSVAARDGIGAGAVNASDRHGTGMHDITFTNGSNAIAAAGSDGGTAHMGGSANGAGSGQNRTGLDEDRMINGGGAGSMTNATTSTATSVAGVMRLQSTRSIPGTPSLNRSYSEGSLMSAPFRKSRARRRLRIAGLGLTMGGNSREHHTAAEQHHHMADHSFSRLLSNTSTFLSISSENLEMASFSECTEVPLGGDSQVGSVVGGVVRRAVSLDSVRPPGSGSGKKRHPDEDGYHRHSRVGASCEAGGSRSPSPTASSGIESGSIKDSPMQIADVLTADSSSIDTQDDPQSFGGSSSSMATTSDRRSILAGGTAKGWLPDVAAVMWRRMLGALGDVNKILNPKLHAQVYQYLVSMTESLIKIRMNQGISLDGSGHSSTSSAFPNGTNLVPPVALVAPWCYGALALDAQYAQGKLYAMQLLCTIVQSGASLGNNQLPLFYHALHQALTGEDRAMAYTALRYLGGPRFLSLLLPGHTLLLLDLVHAATVVLTSSETGPNAPRAQVAGLLGSLLCFPRTSLPGPVLQPSEPHIDLMECPDLQEHVLNVVLRCARREPTAKARCIAIASLGQWILQNLTNPTGQHNGGDGEPAFKQKVPQHSSEASSARRDSVTHTVNPRIREAFQVILQALQFKHHTIARLASETLKLCAEQGARIEQIERLPQLIIDTVCLSLDIHNVPHPKESDKTVLTSLLLTLGELCMSFSVRTLQQPKHHDSTEPLILIVFRILYKIATGLQNGERIKLFTTDEDFDSTIVVDDVRESGSGGIGEAGGYQTAETIASCQSAIRLCAKTVAMHLITNLGHFPMGIGATRLSSLVDEQDDLMSATGAAAPVHPGVSGAAPSVAMLQRENSIAGARVDAMEHVLASPNLQLLMLSPELVASFIELPALKLPGGGATAGLLTANRQVRLLLRDLNGKACWDASILYQEPALSAGSNDTDRNATFQSAAPVSRHYAFATVPTGSGQLAGAGSVTARHFASGSASIDPLMSTAIGLPMSHGPRHTLRHRPVHQLPVAKDLAPDLDQLDDLLQYIGYTSPECLDSSEVPLNTAGPSPLGAALEGQTISIILNQRTIEAEAVARQNAGTTGQPGVDRSLPSGTSSYPTLVSSSGYGSYSPGQSYSDDSGTGTIARAANTMQTQQQQQQLDRSDATTKPFQLGRILFNQLGLAGWERRKRTHLLQRTDKLLRELRNLDNQKCRETHKMAVIYVANGQEDKGSILRNACGSSTYEMFVSALGWEVELESHNGFLGGLPRQGCGQTAPYYATPFLEVIYHVSTRMPSDTPEAILNKTRHLGNDEVHIVWSEHNRDYRRDILPTEFCDVLIVIYPLKSGLFRVTVNKKPEVPWFGPLSDEMVVGGACLASLVRASAINASRAKRSSLPLYQQYYEERNRSIDTVALRHRENSTFEDFTARIFCPIAPQTGGKFGGGIGGGASAAAAAGSSIASGTNAAAPLAAALIDHHSRGPSKTWIHHPEMVATAREVTQQTLASVSLDQPSPRPLRKLHHPFKAVPKGKVNQHSIAAAGGSMASSGSIYGAGMSTASTGMSVPIGAAGVSTPPESPTLPGRKIK
ncbi:probable Rho GTPase-activating protein CG5521 isoform X1 [Anopheles gambiae]|uniref:probable Rho GTPase-activating protein CG5521 isoform X1 n=1 Tax=Anopheles gambiae TaxID=7165 RepID=UPI002AC9014C|nr:probable Rho GTPase-activating protein CG5521 isoform X1 [Anopheles gambiae]